ncbi:hypothetical protein [Bacillus cereus]|uniref:hypothetical protein n=1 Tax=Bacillus cereus TaxID=1396 RepID=UPI001F46A13F|nr:hypothetical protein [Bacillus cereus]BCC56655.1 hypothetical protein BCJMU07_p506 [Bacillus cereus]
MYVKTYQPEDIFAFWRKIQSGTPVEYDFKYVSLEKRGMLQFIIYVHRTKFYKTRGNNVEQFYESFIQKKKNRFDSFFVLLNEQGKIQSKLYEHEVIDEIYEGIECMYSTLPVERDPNELMKKIQHLNEHEEYDSWMKKLKIQRFKSLFKEK